MSRPILTGQARAAFERFPGEISETDLAACFTFPDEELEQIQTTRGKGNALRLALMLGAVRWLGFLPRDLGEAPQVAMRYCARQLGCDPVAGPGPDGSERTLRQLRAQALLMAGFRKFAGGDSDELIGWLAGRAMSHDSPGWLLSEAVQWLRSAGIVRPSLDALERIIGSARSAADQVIFNRLDRHLTEEAKAELDGLLAVDFGQMVSPLAWLREDPRSASPERIREHLDRLDHLRALSVGAVDEGWVADNRRRQLATVARHSTAQAIRRRDPSGRYPVMVAFAAETLGRVTDDLVDLFDQAIGQGHANARRALEQRKLADAEEANEKIHLLGELLAMINDSSIPDGEVRATIWRRYPPERLAEISAESQRLRRPLDGGHYEELEARHRRLRAFTPRLLESLQFAGEPESGELLAAVELLRELNRTGKRTLDAEGPIGFAPRRWLPHLRDSGGRLDRRQWELCLLSELRSELRAGRVWVRGSRRYQPPDSYLIPADRWYRERARATAQLGLPSRAIPRLDRLGALTRERLANLDAELAADRAQVEILDGDLKVGRLPGSERPQATSELAGEISRRLPLVDLSELLIEVDGWCGFSEKLAHGGGSTPRMRRLAEHRYAAILAQACNLGAARMAQAARVSPRRISWVNEWYLRPAALAEANAQIVDFHHSLPLASAWGDGSFSASDGKRFSVGVESAEAQPLPRYFHRSRGVTFYSWTSDQHTHYGSKVIRSTLRDATYVLDGILDNETELPIAKHTTDTAGYSDIVFGLFDLLGLEFAPRLAGITDTRLFATGEMTDSQAGKLIRHRIDQQLIESRWDQLLRIAASLKEGTVTASLLVTRLQASAPRNETAKALREYGRLIKTNFILRYLADETERRAIGAQLNKAEALHALHDTIFFGREQRIRAHALDRQSTQAHCLHLVANAIITWNTTYIAAVLADLRAEGHEINPDDLQRLTPTLYQHINPHGTYNFDQAAIPAEGLRPRREPDDLAEIA